MEKYSEQVTELAKHVVNNSNYPIDDIEHLINMALEADPETIEVWYKEVKGGN